MRRLDYAVEGDAPVLMQIEAADLPDQHVVKSRLDLADAIDFVRVAADEGVGERSLFRVKDRLRCSYAAEVEIDRKLADIRTLEQVPLPALPGEAVKYLMPSRYCQSDLFGGFVEAEFGKLSGGAAWRRCASGSRGTSPTSAARATSGRPSWRPSSSGAASAATTPT